MARGFETTGGLIANRPLLYALWMHMVDGSVMWPMRNLHIDVKTNAHNLMELIIIIGIHVREDD